MSLRKFTSQARPERPIVERSYPLDQAGDGLLHFGEGRSLGRVVFTAEGDRQSARRGWWSVR